MKLIGTNSGGSHAAAEKTKRLPRWAIIAGSVLCAVLLLIAGYFLWEKPPEQSTDPPPAAVHAEDVHSTAQPGQAEATPTPAPEHDDESYTFLIVGRDHDGANTDTILVGRLDSSAHTIDVVSIPRDTMVNTPYNVKKVNTLFAYDMLEGGNGIDGLRSGVKDLTGFDVDCYAVITLTAFTKLVDAIGGVWYEVPFDMYYEDPDQDLHIAIDSGYQLLDGQNALDFVRFRMSVGSSGYISYGGDISRIERQQDFLKTVAKQLIKNGFANLSELIDIFKTYVSTDLSADELAYLARQFLLCGADDISFHTLPGEYGDSVGGFSYVTLYPDEWLCMVNEYLNPWSEDITMDSLNILTRKDGVLWASSGVIAGGEDSFLTLDDYIASRDDGVGSAEEDAPESDVADIIEEPEPEDGDAAEPPPDESEE